MVTKYHGLSITLLLKSKTIKFTSVVHFHTVQILYKTINYTSYLLSSSQYPKHFLQGWWIIFEGGVIFKPSLCSYVIESF